MILFFYFGIAEFYFGSYLEKVAVRPFAKQTSFYTSFEETFKFYTLLEEAFLVLT